VRRYDDEVRRLVQKCRNDVERSMSHAELTDLRQEEQHYEERLKIRMKQRMLNIPWPQRGEVMTNYEARIIARIERCHRNPV
jgi:NADH:ubiquinone oxidoreductase subunit E